MAACKWRNFHYYVLVFLIFVKEIYLEEQNYPEHCLKEEDCSPSSPLVPCENLPLDFLDCEAPLDLKGNETAREELGYGCTKFGGQKYEDVQKTAVNCTVLLGIECRGRRSFMKEGFPCIKYSGHYFVTTLLYSVLLGFLGMDRFCLGHTGTAVGKLLTLGGVGIWWIVDIVLLVTGSLVPEDGSNWVPYA
ncbi:TM2 domain-containing protein 2-like [Centruroides sculpturatus]|uniref:TM2 domain-containing protein 2-like n=1 Tax=Centruroides sculpturatus TaxID=218467 RepID=UPI000C6CFF73|nr:TM2 domain-containing protein 2-like [Centruroides sculpturatus]